MKPLGNRKQGRPLMAMIESRQPKFFEAVAADTRMTAACRGERHELDTPFELGLQALRLMWITDAFLALVLYRLKVRAQVLRIPLLPRLAHKLAMSTAQVCIGDPVIIHPGIYLPHGQVVADGMVEIHAGVRIRPWVTIGLREGDNRGATIERGVLVGTGAKVIGPVTVGQGAIIGANAVVVDDVPPRTTVVGVPARPVGERPPVQKASGT
jgi:serine O-acetyltransferase